MEILRQVMVDIGEEAHIILPILILRSTELLVEFLICSYYLYVFFVFKEAAGDLGIAL